MAAASDPGGIPLAPALGGLENTSMKGLVKDGKPGIIIFVCVCGFCHTLT